MKEMKCQGQFKFKGLTKRDGGEFKNSNGDVIKYKESYSLKVDEQTENGIFERQFKIAIDSPLVNDLSGYELYDNITIYFDVKIYGSRITVIPVAVE